jgi:hypothetical protein
MISSSVFKVNTAARFSRTTLELGASRSLTGCPEKRKTISGASHAEVIGEIASPEWMQDNKDCSCFVTKFSVVEDDVEKGTVDLKLAVVANEAQSPEPVHEEIDSRAGCSHHLCQRLLTDFGNCNFGFSVFAELSQCCRSLLPNT